MTGRMKRWLEWRHFRKTLLAGIAAVALCLGATYSSWSTEVSNYAFWGVMRVESDTAHFMAAAKRLAQPMLTWKRPEKMTLDELLPPGSAKTEGLMMMNQRTSFYCTMYGIGVPEGTKPFFGISHGITIMKPDYLDTCARALRTDRPGVFIGSEMYYFVIEHLEPELTKYYVYLGEMPLFLDSDTNKDPDYTKWPLHWYVRKDLLGQVNHKLVEQLTER
jgi:hypothetical protein